MSAVTIKNNTYKKEVLHNFIVQQVYTMRPVVLFLIVTLNGISANLTFVDPWNVKDGSLMLTIPDGFIYGRRDTTVAKKVPYLSYRGIPYAKPPIGELRFSTPQKNDRWYGVLNCTEDRSECVQQTDPVTGNEDCLYINVYTTSLFSNLPVMVWIYGGIFYEGNSSYYLYGPDYLLEENVVFVSFNYRLGILGFLSTGDLAAPGNWGLKDQVLALEWVQNNIRYFGGDPSRVTIFGESAGSVSVSHMLQTNRTTNLFRGAIMESGHSLDLWAYSRKTVEATYEIADNLRVDTSNSTQMIEGLKKIDVEKLYATTSDVYIELFITNGLEGLVLGPVLEPDNDDAVFTEKSYKLLSSGNFQRVPCIIGFNSNEAIVANDLIELLRLYIASVYDVSRRNLTPADMTQALLKRILAGNKVKEYYVGSLIPMSLAPESEIVAFINDDQFIRGIREAVLLQSEYAPVYMYEFGYSGYLGYQGSRDVRGVGHAEELPYLFIKSDDNITSILVLQSDKTTRARMVRMWTNFAKYLNPTPFKDDLLQNITWPIAGNNRTNLVFLNITENLEVGTNPREESMEFYEELYKKYGDGDYNTY